MSASVKNTTNFRVVVGCKVCKDAGKSESEYSNHFVKDREGKVVCPTLLSLQCRYCQKPGHTVSHCPTLQAKNKAEEKAKRTYQFKATDNNAPNSKAETRPKSKFGFEILDDFEPETNEEETSNTKSEVIKKGKEEFPILGALPNVPSVHAGGFSYASMAAKTVEDFENEQFEKKIKENALKNISVAAIPVPSPYTEKKAPLKASELNWAMLDDSDSDEDW
jgi:hypothetical protein